MTAKEEFLQHYEEHIKKFEKVDEKDENFNVFQVLSLEHYEIRHSSFLVWLLKNEAFRKAFFRKCNIPEKLAVEKIDIDTEQSFNEVDEEGKFIYLIREKKGKDIYQKGEEAVPYIRTEDGSNDGYKKLDSDDPAYQEVLSEMSATKGKQKLIRKIDINLIGETYTLTIENKVDSGQHDNQCIAYRHFMETDEAYRDLTHCFVFLAPRKPEDFDSSCAYQKYHFVDYEAIKDVLGALEWSGIKGEIVRQYVEVVDGWNHFPKKYESVFSADDFDLSPFADEKYGNIKKIADTLTGQQQRFVNYARQYYTMMKAETDTTILSVLQTMSKDEYFIKEDYGRGNYAKAIPVAANNNVLKDKELYEYAYNRGWNDEEERELWKNGSNKEKRQEADDKIKNSFLTHEAEKYRPSKELAILSVDYRAPRGDYSYPSVRFASGVNKAQAVSLCGILKDGRAIHSLEQLKKSDWKPVLTLGCKSGAGGSDRVFEQSFSISFFANMPEKERAELFDSKINRAINAADVFSDGFWEYLTLLKKYAPVETASFGKTLLKKLLDENSGYDQAVLNCMNNMTRYLEQEALLKQYQEWKEQDPAPSFYFTKITEVTGRELNDKEKENITQQIEFAVFKNKFVNEAKKRFGKKLQVKKLDTRKYKEFTILWCLELDYPLTPEEASDQASMAKAFYKKTLEGSRFFGLEDFFQNTIFKDPTEWAFDATDSLHN